MLPDSIDYAKGETPMTDYQFQQFEKLWDENDALKKELSLLKGQNAKPSETGMTNYQYKVMIESLYQLIKAKFEAGASPEEILQTVAAFKEEK